MIDVLLVNSSQAEAVECAPDIKGESHEDKIERQEELRAALKIYKHNNIDLVIVEVRWSCVFS